MATPHEQMAADTLGGARPARNDVLNFPATIDQLLAPSAWATGAVTPWLWDTNTTPRFIFESNLLYYSPQTVTTNLMPNPSTLGGVPRPLQGSINSTDFNMQLAQIQANLLGAP